MKPTVLTIDDDPVVRKLVKKAVEGMGYDSVEVPSGIEGLSYLEKAIPQLILLDAMMPVVDGFEVLKKIKEHREWRSIPVMMFTAVSHEEKVREAIALGAVDYLLKPFRLQAVREKIDQVLGDGKTASMSGDGNAGGAEAGNLPSIVMVVSSDRITQNRFHRFLVENGIRSIKADSSLKGLRLLESSVPDTIILDNNLKVFDASELEKKIAGSANWRHIPVLRLDDKATSGKNVISSTIPEGDFLEKLGELWSQAVRKLPREERRREAKISYRILLMAKSDKLYDWYVEQVENAYEVNNVTNSSELIATIINWDPDFVLINYPDYQEDAYGILKRCQETLGGGNLKYFLFSREQQTEEVYKKVRSSGFERLIVPPKKGQSLREFLDGSFGVNLVEESMEGALVVLKRKPTLSQHAGREILHRIMMHKSLGKKRFLLDYSTVHDIGFHELEDLGQVTNHQTKLGIKICIVSNSPYLVESFRSFHETETVEIVGKVDQAKEYLAR